MIRKKRRRCTLQSTPEKRVHHIQIWIEIWPTLQAIEDMMSMRVKKGILSKDEQKASRGKPLTPTEEEHRRRILMMQRVQDSPTSGSGSTRIFISLEGRVGSSCSWWSADG
ncbi:hypothetical protein V6N13_103789 [Hibiscus sabdariffa]